MNRLRWPLLALLLFGLLLPAAANPGPLDWPLFRRDLARSGLAPGSGQIVSPTERWELPVRGLAEPSPAVGDLDGDGAMEVVAGSYGGIYAIVGASGTELWEFQMSGPFEVSSPAIGDLDNDGAAEVVVGSMDGNVYALDGRTGRVRWSYRTGAKVWSSPTLADVDGDGRLEVLIASDKVYALSGLTGSPKWSFLLELGSISSPAVGDLDGNGRPEVVIGADDELVYALQGLSGHELWHFELPVTRPRGFIEHSSPALGDVDGDGSLEVAIGVSNHGLYLLDGRSGHVRWSFPIEALVRSSPAIGDLDGDGRVEIVIGSNDHKVYALDGAMGRLEWS
ncbi:MAG: FG-GAP-like repeat-containing protein, partial [Candidatus Bipolaricaulia bacterium]